MKEFLKKAFPFLSTAAVLGGPLAQMAVNTVGAALGIDGSKIEPTLDGIAGAILKAAPTGLTPEQLSAMQQGENNFQLQMKKLNLDSVEAMEKLANEDVANARDREKIVRDHTPEIGFYLLTTCFTLAVCLLFFHSIPPENKAVIFTAFGSMGTAWYGACQYFYGTTRGSENKTQVLASAARNGGLK